MSLYICNLVFFFFLFLFSFFLFLTLIFSSTRADCLWLLQERWYFVLLWNTLPFPYPMSFFPIVHIFSSHLSPFSVWFVFFLAADKNILGERVVQREGAKMRIEGSLSVVSILFFLSFFLFFLLFLLPVNSLASLLFFALLIVHILLKNHE